ncbi:hypothetical protein WICPIJ_005593 [Wickerhamomyces pijperi]|uniref:Uncharacterized protein n=1 Tax=Wickerhamomyces pijperi TaxID=599730 RepID=A0A9P8TM77_WICPI|nr:hypothetical protein WICPIJ_005593 [Wickerhamomyces pijperi]
MIATENKALAPSAPIKTNKEISMDNPQTKNKALTGTAKASLTTLKYLENGKPSSLAKAQACLETAVTTEEAIKN